MTHDICLRSEPLALRSLKVKVSGPCRGATRTPNLHAPPSIDQVRRTTAPYQMLTKPLKLYSAPCRIHRCAPGRAAPVSKAAEYCTVQLDQAVGGTLEVGWNVLVHSESRKYLVRSYKVPVQPRSNTYARIRNPIRTTQGHTYDRQCSNTRLVVGILIPKLVDA